MIAFVLTFRKLGKDLVVAAEDQPAATRQATDLRRFAVQVLGIDANRLGPIAAGELDLGRAHPAQRTEAQLLIRESMPAPARGMLREEALDALQAIRGVSKHGGLRVYDVLAEAFGGEIPATFARRLPEAVVACQREWAA